MLLFCVVAGLLGHASALEPMGVSDILGGLWGFRRSSSKGTILDRLKPQPRSGTQIGIQTRARHGPYTSVAWIQIIQRRS
eukprot:scaffold72539_cov63-Phaeocystis_antarctica.AAC.1